MGTALLTGFPGFIGTRLVARLLADDPDLRVAALVEERMAPRAREVAVGLEQPDRLEVLTGDITAPRLGLTPADHDRLAAQATQVHHLAAVYDLSVPPALAERVNVEGTRNVVAFAAAAPNLERHHYVSTAYVAGRRHGVVRESELEHGAGFKNHYESTKHEAERVVRASMDAVPTTIYRPAIVVGDSRTGVTQKFDGPYYMLRMLDVLRRLHQPVPQIGRGDAHFNVVPIDFVIDAIAAGVSSQAARGETLHLTDPEPLTSQALIELLASRFGSPLPSYRVPPALLEASLRLRPVRATFVGVPPESIGYLNHSVRFDTERAQAVLEPAGVRCPRFHEYVDIMVGFFTEHRNDPAMRPLSPSVPRTGALRRRHRA
ncbi:MAG: SDR family oxidoreductase [Actinomycetota bacterium]|nr:SDR family oxidoreductase [Actinomycetota bacterium]